MKTTQLFKSAKIVAICSTVLLFAGCAVDVTEKEVTDGLDMCKDHGGLKKIEKQATIILPNYYCNDEASFRIYGSRIDTSFPISKSK